MPRLRLVGMRSSVRGGAMNAPNSVQIEPEEAIQMIFTEKGTRFVKVKDRRQVRDSGC
jgi:sRNA-binding carbon storage regulator CsrA